MFKQQKQRRLSALLAIRRRGHITNRPFRSRKSELLGFNDDDGAIWADSSGYIRCSRQEVGLKWLTSMFRLRKAEMADAVTRSMSVVRKLDSMAKACEK